MIDCIRRQCLIAMVLLQLTLVGACVSTTTERASQVTFTLEQAKQEVWQIEDELVTYLPASAIVKRWPRVETSKVLFKCEEPGRYNWPGAMQIGVAKGTDFTAIMHSIHDGWADRSGWQVTWLADGPRAYHLDLLRDDGLHVAVMNLENDTVFQVNSFSPCFELTEYDPNKSY